MPDAALELTFSQLELLTTEPEELKKQHKWALMNDAARAKVRRLQRDGFTTF